ncbi:MAG: homoserine dehydrogenase, partial [Clostridium celatum]|nr:homoserine dehydrogenase [Clostridium celatum]
FITKKKYIFDKYNLKINVKCIIKSNGGLYSETGIDLKELMSFIKKNEVCKHKLWHNEIKVESMIKNANIDTLIELTPTNIVDGEPALTYIRNALENKKNVITGNKGPIVLKYKELKAIADNNGVKLKIGCTTGGALPSISGGIYDVAGSEIKSIEGILNGTTNYILTKMTNDEITYEKALKEAQEEGIVESNPSLDVLGYDTASKIIILSNVLMNTDIKLSDLKIQGITDIKLEDLKLEKSKNKKVKLIGKIEKNNDEVIAYIKQMQIDESHPLYSVDYKNKGVYYKTDTLGDISIIGGASGTMNAAASILRDIILLKEY